MKVAVTVLAFVATVDLVLGGPGYGPPQPLPSPQKYRPPNGAPIPAKYPPFPGGPFGKNEFYSKYNPHSLPPGLRGPQPQLPPPFGKYPPPSKQQHHQHQLQIQHPHPQQQQQQQQLQQQKYNQPQQQQKPHHAPNFRPLGPQFQSKPHLAQNSFAVQEHGNQDQRPTAKITNGWTGPRPQQPAGPPDFPPRFPATVAAAAAAASSAHVAVATPTPYAEKVARPSYIINSDDERGPIKTIPAPNLNPADRPADFEEQLYRAQHQQSYAQPLDNSITDDKQLYQVTEDPSVYKPFSSQPSYFAPDLDVRTTPKVPSVGKVPLDIALQQHLDKQHQQFSAEHAGANGDTLTPQELYSLLNGNQAAAAQQTAYMVPQTVMYAVPQSQDLQVGHQLHYQPQGIQLQYAAQQPTAAAAVQLQYAQPTAADLQYLQPQPVQYQQQAVQYHPQPVQYQQPAVSYQQYQQMSTGDQHGSQPTAESVAYNQQQEQQQQLQEQQQHQQEQQQSQQEQQQQLQEQQQEQQEQQQQQQQQQQDNDVQYQQEQADYEPRNREKDIAEQQQQQQQEPIADEEATVQDQSKFESIRDQYYSAVPNEQTAGVLAQIAQSAANNDAATAIDEPGRVNADQPSTQLKTTVQVQKSVPLYEGTYASSRRTNQEYVDEGGDNDGELMMGSESAVAGSDDASVNGHAPSQFPYNAAKINAFAAN
ncbi:mediator of RNA polymerase II transcription subunit 15-like [Sipha flava]|uniref:Mediator of RNA polymerase II transcription subunit 15-like n=1 Tax=Sipha flava TaxID=143950 RepID=A0A8B8FAT8_9HEMI|nr:mediator of RNA polymerase II transcription subunit 15-like [Sipha flava]